MSFTFIFNTRINDEYKILNKLKILIKTIFHRSLVLPAMISIEKKIAKSYIILTGKYTFQKL